MITKQFMKSKPVCKATFSIPAELAPEAKTVVLLGEFNGWNAEDGIQMKKQKDGIFKAVVELEAGKEFQFRYLVDGQLWINDNAADKYIPTPFGVENSVVVTLN
ncbi:MAG: isoamylase early set domain-containing protein [Saprospiraceae bacterium]|jgi:1,4-alpha-glucan branching enzyme|nr:isoamylase early set domain-containing protein [Saprospiraceae bacterium]HRD82747.1 isoamylase early set domain-containing protein [Saprospiraceae bacterium]HRJ15779.1 isoamylase early set domain-containing protein [Saprospiraceae bacterium]HRK83097.1 isoamylase early set domain-containing protein [Saprospiraceae bacterium]